MEPVFIISLSVYTLGWLFAAAYLFGKGWNLAQGRDSSRQRLADLERMKTKIAGMKDRLQELLDKEEQPTIQ